MNKQGRTQFVGLKLTRKEASILRQAAQADERTISDFVRRLIRDGLKKFGYKLD